MTLGFLRTRVGRRYLAVNLLSALLPLLALGGLTYAFVRGQTRDSAEDRVAQLSKSLTLTTLGALTSVARDDARTERPDAGDPTSGVQRFPLNAGVPALDGRPGTERPLTAPERDHLLQGGTLLVMSSGAAEGDALLRLATVTPDRTQVTWRQANPGFLWSPSDEALAGDDASYCVFESETAERVHCAADMSPAEVIAAREVVRRASQVRRVEMQGGYLAATRDIYLTHEFATRAWKAVVLQPTALVFAPLAPFRRLLVLSLLAIAILIFVVSHSQIRRTTEPLAQIRDGTIRVQAGDFSRPVTVDSRDEYGDVAASFNQMASTLDRQIQLLGNLDAIDRSALSTTDQSRVVQEGLGSLSSALPCSRVVIAVAVPGEASTFEVTAVERTAPLARTHRARMWEGERSELLVDAGWFTLSAGEQRSWLPKAAAHREVEILVLPLIHDRELMGVIALALGSEAVIGGELRSEARRLADRIALALGHVDLVQRLEALSAGTIVAFARAIDANSPWTAGHSERVTDVAMMLGARLGLSASELRTLKRGGLLHDIGKIAIPAAILDKAARLSDDEWVVMQRHPVVGVEILSPIPGFTDVLPLVRSHHERMDGLGYPDRLRGEAIPFLARVLAVADVFDALVSHRPYRSGMTLERTTDIIRQESGAHLDPQVVEVFLQGVRAGDIRHDFIALDSRTLADTVARTRRGILVAT